MAMLIPLPFVRALQQQGGRVYTVGGTVRDDLLGEPRKDVDLLVAGLPQQTLIRLLRQHGRVQLIGRAFGMIKFLPRRWDGPPIDIALPRTEVSTGTGHRDFEVSFDHTLPIETDLGRRDFTINALAIDLETEQVIDPFDGRRDLDQRLLRQVSVRAFPEDPLRMLRGIQLAARFGLTVETATRQAMQAHAASMTTVAPERIAEELRKLFQAASPASGFILMRETGLLPYILPELAGRADIGDPIDDVFTRAMRRLDAVQQREELVYRGHLDLLLAALLQDSQHPEQAGQGTAQMARERLEALKMRMIGAHLDRIETLIRERHFAVPALVSDVALRHFVSRVSPDIACMLVELRLADHWANKPEVSADDLLALRQRLQDEIARNTPFSLKELAINGHDLQRLGIPPGPQMGHLLQRLLHRVLDDPSCNTRAALLAIAQQEADASA